MKILIATGGTGGHIFPALALADELMKKNPENEILFIGTEYRIEKDIIPERGYRFIGLNITSTSGSVLNKIGAMMKLVSSYFECRRIIKKENADICIGFGNYISIPLIMAASRMGVKTMIHEQNSYAGKANIFLAKHVDEVVGCYEDNLQQLENPNTKILGNPRASAAAKIKKDSDILKELGLDLNKKTVLVVMGSLGSSSVNEVMRSTLAEMDNKNYQVLYVAGKNTREDFLAELGEFNNVVVKKFIDGIKVMVNMDLIISRAGATTLAEITALGLPAILIPSPYVPNNHQVLNAKVLADADGAVMIEEKDLYTDKLVETVETIINDEKRLEDMREKMMKFSYSNASSDIIKDIEELVR